MHWITFIGRVASGRLTGKILRSIAIPCALALLLAGLACPLASGDVGVVLNESLDSSLDRITGTGHSAVYFSRICPDSPVKLRLCGPGEHGSVMSNYINIGEDEPFEWNVVPLNVYLYGVEDTQNRPIFGSFKIKHVLEERYRKNYLSSLCASSPCMNSYKSEWREMVAATLIRSVYIFAIDTTEEQDRELIAEFNASPNENHFNGVTRNCADFTQRVINTYFSNATRTDYLNDFGMTSPKAVARSFTRYALRHPESNLRVLHFAQVPGTIKRSREVRAGTEQLYRSKKFLIPLILFADPAVAAVAGSYLLTGRFNPGHEFERHPAVQELSPQDKRSGTVAPEERTRVLGTSKEWKEYRKAFDSLVVQNIQEDVIDDRGDLKHFFKQFDKAGRPFVDEHGSLWMETSANGESAKVGLSAGNVLAQDSDPKLAHQLLLTRIDHVLKSPKHSREPMIEFVQDWTALQHASEKRAMTLARSASPAKGLKDTQLRDGADD
ncbi:MAG TPA: hypothetical protein VJO16_18290 [Candidatus Acidoferrum sp.]|nr:hypothetical protein [Candidatus Acidoferrum sp.]